MTLDEFLREWHDGSPLLKVHTSGSTGTPKPLWVEKARMVASARMTCDFLGLDASSTALLCMPLDYIAGKMMVVRALVAGMRLLDVQPSGHPMAAASLQGERVDLAAMVPLQVYNTLQCPDECDRLMQVRHLLVGGGGIDAAMERQLAGFPNAVWSTYGMTETLSHVALRRVNGPEASPWYRPLPGVTLATDDDGCLVVEAPALCNTRLHTNDIVEMNSDGDFKVVGRKDNVICTGGIKVQAEEVERLLQPHLPVPFFITKEKDEKYGEIIVLVIETIHKKTLEDITANVLPRYWRPRKTVILDHLPRTETGKPKRFG